MTKKVNFFCFSPFLFILITIVYCCENSDINNIGKGKINMSSYTIKPLSRFHIQFVTLKTQQCPYSFEFCQKIKNIIFIEDSQFHFFMT